MNLYERSLFKRGFLFTGENDIISNYKHRIKVSKFWSTVEILGEYSLFYEPSVTVSKVEKENKFILLIGLTVNPFSEENIHSNIACNLFEKYFKNKQEYYNYLDELSGRFAIIIGDAQNIEIFGDACGTRTIYYNSRDEGNAISSHSLLLATVTKSNQNENAHFVMTTKEFTGRKYLPGVMSPYTDIKALTPNTSLNFRTKEVARFFPRENNSVMSFAEGKEKVKDIFSKQIKLIADYNKLLTSITAGLDSRFTMAFLKKIDTNSHYYTYISKSNPKGFQNDYDIGVELSKRYNLKHTGIEYNIDNDQKDLREFRHVWQSNVGMYRGSLHLNKKLADTFNNDVLHIRSNIAEVARLYYKKRDGTPSNERLSELFTSSDFKHNNIVKEAFEEFIEKTSFNNESFYNYNYADLFYWEHRMSMWLSWIINENDTAFDTFIPFNNRELLKIMLSIPENMRKDDKLFLEIIHDIDKSLLEVPINNKILN